MRKAVKASLLARPSFSLATLVGAVALAGGCHTYDEPPFNPREMGRNSRLASQERIIREKEPIPPRCRRARAPARPSAAATTRSRRRRADRPPEPAGDHPADRRQQQRRRRRRLRAGDRRDPRHRGRGPVRPDVLREPHVHRRGSVLSPSSSIVSVDPFNPSGFQSLSAQTGIRQNLLSGGTAELSYRTQRIRRDEGSTDTFGDAVNPYYLNELLLRVTQPLLRDFGAEINRARITIARNNQRISVLEFRRSSKSRSPTIEQALLAARAGGAGSADPGRPARPRRSAPPTSSKPRRGPAPT